MPGPKRALLDNHILSMLNLKSENAIMPNVAALWVLDYKGNSELIQDRQQNNTRVHNMAPFIYPQKFRHRMTICGSAWLFFAS